MLLFCLFVCFSLEEPAGTGSRPFKIWQDNICSPSLLLISLRAQLRSRQGESSRNCGVQTWWCEESTGGCTGQQSCVWNITRGWCARQGSVLEGWPVHIREECQESREEGVMDWMCWERSPQVCSGPGRVSGMHPLQPIYLCFPIQSWWGKAPEGSMHCWAWTPML